MIIKKLWHLGEQATQRIPKRFTVIVPFLTDTNRETYTASSIVWYYTQLHRLQPAEQTILDLLRDRLPTMKMLDIGIGGGRTTQHFAPLAGEYTGIDYSATMVAACKKRFAKSLQPLALEVGDAREMSQFADNSFDFILFSFNGIDYASVSDRLQILAEIARVGKPGSYFFFSSHNLQAMISEFDWKSKVSFNPFKTYVNLVMLALLNLYNSKITRDQLETSNHIIIKDESHNFRLQTYYIRPKKQIEQLSLSFKDIEIYSWKSGLKVVDMQDLLTNSDKWLYYLCLIK